MSPKTPSRPLRAGQLAQLAGLSTDTLRHYERKGLLTPGRSSNGYREYPPGALARVRLIQQALSVGFRLDELARVLSIRDHGGAPCHQVRALAAEKLESIESQLSNLKVLRRQLRGLLREWDARLARTPKGEQAGLLDRLSESTIRPALRRASPSPSWNLRRR